MGELPATLLFHSIIDRAPRVAKIVRPSSSLEKARREHARLPRPRIPSPSRGDTYQAVVGRVGRPRVAAPSTRARVATSVYHMPCQKPRKFVHLRDAALMSMNRLVLDIALHSLQSRVIVRCPKTAFINQAFSGLVRQSSPSRSSSITNKFRGSLVFLSS